MTAILDTLKAAIAETLDITAAAIDPNDSLQDLGADSLDEVEIAMAVESALGLDTHIDGAFQPTDNPRAPTISQIATAIETQISKAA